MMTKRAQIVRTLLLFLLVGCSSSDDIEPPKDTSAPTDSTPAPEDIDDSDDLLPTPDVDEDTSDGTEVEEDAYEPPGPVDITVIDAPVSSTLEATTEAVSDWPVTAIAALDSSRALIVTADELWEVGGQSPIAYGDTAGVISNTTVLDPDTALVFGDGGVFVAGFGELVESPMGAVVTTVDTAALEPGGTPWRLWLAADQSLHLWENETLSAVVLDGVSDYTTPPLLAATADPPTLWVAQNESLTALVVDDDEIAASIQLIETPCNALASTPSGTVWLLSEGNVFFQSPGESWVGWSFSESVVQLATSPDNDVVWLATGSTLYRFDNELVEVTGVALDTLLTVDTTGRALVGGDAGVTRIQATVPEVHWDPTIKDIYSKHCAACHQEHGGMPLNKPQCWYEPESDESCTYDPGKDLEENTTRWQRTLDYIQSDYMPAVSTKLTTLEKDNIEFWGAGGFLE